MCREITDNINNKYDMPLISFLIPIYNENILLKELLSGMLSQRTFYNWNVIIVDGCEDEKYSEQVKLLIEILNNDHIIYYKNNNLKDKTQMINYGVEVATGYWICQLDTDFVLLADAMNKIGNLVCNIDKCFTKKVGYISLWYKTLRVNTKNVEKVVKEIKKYELRYSKKFKEYNVIKITRENINYGGSLGIIEPAIVSLYSREAFLEVGGLDDEKLPLESSFLVNKLKKKYSVCNSVIPYGVFVSMDCVYPTKELFWKAYKLWMEYLDECYSKTINIKKRKERMNIIKSRYIYSLIRKHKSYNLSIADFDKYITGLTGWNKYMFGSVFEAFVFDKKVKAQFLKNEIVLRWNLFCNINNKKWSRR